MSTAGHGTDTEELILAGRDPSVFMPCNAVLVPWLLLLLPGLFLPQLLCRGCFGFARGPWFARGRLLAHAAHYDEMSTFIVPNAVAPGDDPPRTDATRPVCRV